MQYVRTDGATTILPGGWPYPIAKLRLDEYPASIPKQPTLAQLAEFDVYPVTNATPAVPGVDYDINVEIIITDAQPTWTGSLWELGWSKRNMNQQELDARAEGAFEGQINVQRNSIVGLQNEQLRDVLGVIYSEYMAYQANNSVATPAIQQCATTWGVTRGQAVTRIINKYGGYITGIAEEFAIREDAFP